MKINPENIITDEDLCLKYKSFFISGNDESYIFALVDMLVKNFTKNGYVRKNLNNNDDLEPDLFKVESKYVYVSDKYSGDRYVEGVEANKDVLIFYEKSLAKNRSIKQFFSTSKERALLECYQLDQGKKKIILNGFIKKNELVFENSVYWLLLDLLDNRYAILIKELEKVLLLNNKVDMLEIANVLNIGRSTDANKFFFKIHLSRSDITAFIS